MRLAVYRSKTTLGTVTVRLNGSSNAPGCPAATGGLTAPRPAAKRVIVEPRSAGFDALTTEPSALTKIPIPAPVPFCVKIPGSNGATRSGMSLLGIDADSTRILYEPGKTSVGNIALICPGETESKGNGTMFAPDTRRTRVVPSICGSAPGPAAKLAGDKF